MEGPNNTMGMVQSVPTQLKWVLLLLLLFSVPKVLLVCGDPREEAWKYI